VKNQFLIKKKRKRVHYGFTPKIERKENTTPMRRNNRNVGKKKSGTVGFCESHGLVEQC